MVESKVIKNNYFIFNLNKIFHKVSMSNNDPRNIAKFYMESIKKYSLLPRVIRADFGTENLSLAPFNRHSDMIMGIARLGQRVSFTDKV
jgi:hypothetical protein